MLPAYNSRRQRHVRARLCFEAARDEIQHVRVLQFALAERGQKLGPFLKQQAVAVARYYVRAGRAFLHTTARVSLRADLKPW